MSLKDYGLASYLGIQRSDEEKSDDGIPYCTIYQSCSHSSVLLYKYSACILLERNLFYSYKKITTSKVYPAYLAAVSQVVVANST